MNTRKLLYIEDNFHNRRIVRKIMEQQGYEVHEAEDGLVGFQMIEEMKPPLVLLDISLPGMDGIEIARRVKADPRLKHILLIALTASAMQGDRERFLEAGCDDYMSKPFKALALVEMVNHHFKEIEARPAEPSVPQITPSEAHAPGREPPRRPVDIDTVRPPTRTPEPEAQLPEESLEEAQLPEMGSPPEVETAQDAPAAFEETEALTEPGEALEETQPQEEAPMMAEELEGAAAAPAAEVQAVEEETVAEEAAAEQTAAQEPWPEVEPAPARSDDEPLVWLPESKLDLDSGTKEPQAEAAAAAEPELEAETAPEAFETPADETAPEAGDMDAEQVEAVEAAVEVDAAADAEVESEPYQTQVDVVTKIHTAPLDPSAVDGKDKQNGTEETEEKEIDYTKLSRRDRNQHITENILEMINPEMLRPVDPNGLQEGDER